MYNKKTKLFCYLLTLLPLGLGLLLGRGGRIPGAVLGTPVLLALTLWFCMYITEKTEKDPNKNRKINNVVIWMIPALSNVTFWMSYRLFIQGAAVSVTRYLGLLFGIMFLVLGNYMPKCRMNSTVGIRVKWTYASEKNWNATHRMAGPVWMACGVAMLLLSFLPQDTAMPWLMLVLVVGSVLPVIYSYWFYQQQLSRREPLRKPQKANPKVTKVATWAVVFVLVLTAVLLFTGSVQVRFEETQLEVRTSYYGRAALPYSDIESVELREENVPGTRTWGLGSFRLLAGYFENQEFGPYVRFTYYNPHSAIVLHTTKGQTLVLSGKNPDKTREIYEQILARIPDGNN